MKLLALFLLVVSTYGVSAQKTMIRPPKGGGGGTKCSTPSGLSTSNITISSATANWSPVSGAISYNVDYKQSSSSTWINIASGTTSLSWNLLGLPASTSFDLVNIANGTTSLSWTIGGLTPTTSYDWRVRTNCSSGISSYTQTQFTSGALGSCSAPGGLYASNVASSTATLNWSLVSGAFSYTVQYKPVSSGSWLYATSGTNGTSVNLYSLSANTTYDWRVYASCSLTEVSSYSTGQFTSGSTGNRANVTSPSTIE